MKTILSISLAAGLVCAAGCGANVLGHSRFYEPLGAEEAALAGAEDYDPVMARRNPEDWQKKKVSLFGVVKRRDDLRGGRLDLVISVRTLEARNLCESFDEGSCRTTVSEHEHDQVHVRLTPASAEDELGRLSIGAGSLLRIVGKLAPETHPQDGGQAIEATYYRHWPRGAYVTTAAASVLRR